MTKGSNTQGKGRSATKGKGSSQERRKINAESKKGMVGSKTNHTEGS
jgi:hypothetical protein